MQVEVVFKSLGEWREQLSAMRKTVDDVVDNCESFGLARPPFDSLVAIEVCAPRCHTPVALVSSPPTRCIVVVVVVVVVGDAGGHH